MTWPRPIVLAVVAALAWTGTAESQQQDVYALRAGAWDRSLELERRGDLRGARDLLMRAWGPESDSYEVTVRLAYLENRLGRTDESIALYRRARAMPPADFDAAIGLSGALTDEGFSRLDDGDRGGARARFEEAIAAETHSAGARQGLRILGPESRVDPEVWVAYLRQEVEPDRFQGWALFAHVPWWTSDSVRLRLAGRYLETYGESYTSGPSAPPQGRGAGRQGESTKTSTDRQGELYGSVGWYGRYIGLEGMGFGLVRKGEGLVPGGAASLRLGGRAGLLLQQAAIGRNEGLGLQAMPQVYWWPSRSFGLAAGARYTNDPQGGDIAAVGGLSIVGESAGLHLQGHAGKERWPVSMETPSIMALDAELTMGATATSTFRLGESWHLGVQGQWEQLEVPAFEGSYYSLSTGLIWSP